MIIVPRSFLCVYEYVHVRYDSQASQRVSSLFAGEALNDMLVSTYAKGPDGTRGFRLARTRPTPPPRVEPLGSQRSTLGATPADRMIRHALGSSRAVAPPSQGAAWTSVAGDNNDLVSLFERARVMNLLSSAELNELTNRIARGESTEGEPDPNPPWFYHF